MRPSERKPKTRALEHGGRDSSTENPPVTLSPPGSQPKMVWEFFLIWGVS